MKGGEATMSDNTLVNDGTDNVNENNQGATSKTYTQEEFDDHMARMKNSIIKKYEKKYEELGDVDELRTLKTEAEKRRQEEQLKRGEFEKTLQELASKKDAEIAKRDTIIRDYKIDTPLVNAAAKFRAVNAEQVKALLKNNLRLNSEGDVEVISQDGQVRYSDAGKPLAVDDLVKEFLDSNPHFVQPTPATTNTKSSHLADSGSKVDVTKLDMSKPEHRELYKKYRKEHGLA